LNWKAKALIQRMCAEVPLLGPCLYGVLQKTCGGLRVNDPRLHLRVAANMMRSLKNAGFRVAGARVLEVGTGWDLNLAMGLYLCGVGEIFEFDIRRSLTAWRVRQGLDFVRTCPDEVRDILGDHLVQDRLESLQGLRTAEELSTIAGVIYSAPSDCTATTIPAASVDLHVSFGVFEHLQPEALHRILVEAARVLKPSGAAIHEVDLGDHFAHSDTHLSSIDFLRYSKTDWSRIAGNRFAFHNRLRAPEYRRIYEGAGQKIINWRAAIDRRSLDALSAGFPLHPDYRSMTHEELATYKLQILSRS